MMPLQPLVARSPDPDTLTRRLDALRENAAARKAMQGFSDPQWRMLLDILSLSDFLFRFLCRHPEDMSLLGHFPGPCPDIGRDTTLSVAKRWKYRCLLQISALDLGALCPYPKVLALLTELADDIIQQVHDVALCRAREPTLIRDSLASLALGKLGARELNYSSDIDLIFVYQADNTEAQQLCGEHIRCFSRLLEARDEEGFFYRVDLNLRPLGRSAPLVLSVDATEQYYEGSKEAWERLAWLRARPLTGNPALARELLGRLQPFVYHRALSQEDLQRFLQIKSAMAKQRQRGGEWSIKTGRGGIRDIEFFVQILQILNGARHPGLQVTNTLKALDELWRSELISDEHQRALRESYLFLRKLEHRVQMVDEQQTHALSEDRAIRMRIACAMGYPHASPDAQLEQFQAELSAHQRQAQSFFETLLEQAT